MKIQIPEDCRCISLVGGGGKTTLMLRLAGQLRDRGKRVILMTTTHMLRPDVPEAVSVYPGDLPWNLQEDPVAVEKALKGAGWILVGRPDPKNPVKMIGVTESFWHCCREMADVLLIEADGARRRPVKVPCDHEPVIPEETDLTIAVLGLSGLDRTIEQAAYEPERLAMFLGTETSHVLTPADAAKVLSRKAGLRKDARGIYCVILHQADTMRRVQQAEAIGALLPGDIPCQITGRREKTAAILLAAGNSTRFEGNKLLAKLPDGRTMVEHAFSLLEEMNSSEVSERILVSQYPEILQMCEGRPGWKTVRNDRPDLGIAESIRRGILAAGPCDSYLFCVADQPNLRPATVRGILNSWKDSGYGIVTAWDGEHPGNPKLFSAAYLEELLALHGDRGGARIMKRHPEDVLWYRVLDARELQDVDEKADLYRIKTGP